MSWELGRSLVVSKSNCEVEQWAKTWPGFSDFGSRAETAADVGVEAEAETDTARASFLVFAGIGNGRALESFGRAFGAAFVLGLTTLALFAEVLFFFTTGFLVLLKLVSTPLLIRAKELLTQSPTPGLHKHIHDFRQSKVAGDLVQLRRQVPFHSSWLQP